MSLFQYLSENSPVAAGFDNNECIKLIRELSGDYNENIGLLEILYRLDKNIPSERFADLIYQQSAHLKKIIDYLELPKTLVAKLETFVHQGELKNYVKSCAKSGDIKGLIFARENGAPLDPDACFYAAEGGHFECLKYLHEEGYPWDMRLCCVVAKKGYIECLAYAHEPPTGDSCPWNFLTFDSAVSGGHIDCLDYLYKHDCPDWDYMYHTAVTSKQLESIKWLYAAGYPLNKDVFAQAAYTGNLECMELLYRLGCPLDIVTPANAAWQGHISCLKWLYERGCYFGPRICMWAAIGGHLDCLKLLRGVPISCPWDYNTLVGAYVNNKHECFAYARENGCPGIPKNSIVFEPPKFPYSMDFDESYKLNATIHYPVCWLD